MSETTEVWEVEPDELDGEFYGLPCLLRRNDLGAWCGYVGITKNHSLYDETDYIGTMSKLDVHGGISFTNRCADLSDSHDPELWWIGFDCAHAGDEVPKLIGLIRPNCDTYRDIEYAKSECESLAKQLAEWDQ